MRGCHVQDTLQKAACGSKSFKKWHNSVPPFAFVDGGWEGEAISGCVCICVCVCLNMCKCDMELGWDRWVGNTIRKEQPSRKGHPAWRWAEVQMQRPLGSGGQVITQGRQKATQGYGADKRMIHMQSESGWEALSEQFRCGRHEEVVMDH